MIDWKAVGAGIKDFSHPCHCECGNRHLNLAGPNCAIAWLFGDIHRAQEEYETRLTPEWVPEISGMISEGSPLWTVEL